MEVTLKSVKVVSVPLTINHRIIIKKKTVVKQKMNRFYPAIEPTGWPPWDFFAFFPAGLSYDLLRWFISK